MTLTGPVVCVSTASLLCACTLAGAQPVDVDRLLKMKPVPGVEALLLSHATDGRVGRRWIGLLSHDDAAIRLSAARALGVTNVKASAPDLLRALSREQDVDVVAELTQAIAIVGSDEDVLQVHGHLHRIGDARASALLDGLAAARPALIARHLTTADPLRFNDVLVRAAYARLARTSPSGADQVDAALIALPDPVVLSGVIKGATAAHRTLAAPLVKAGVGLPPAGRLAAATYLATLYGNPVHVREALALDAAAAAAIDEGAEGVWTHEVVRRWLGASEVTGLAEVISTLPDVAWIKTTRPHVLAVLTMTEREAFVDRFKLSPVSGARLLTAQVGEPTADSPPASAIVLTDLPAVMLADVVRITACRPQPTTDEQFATVRYRADRRPAGLAWPAETWSPGCARAARAAVSMAYGTPPVAETERTPALVRLDPEFTACLADRQGPSGTTAAAASGDAAPMAPRKLKDVPPAYPDTAVRSRIQGIVDVEAQIERSGCVSEAKVVRSVHPLLDTAAVQAVSRWRHTSTTLNGEPVPLLMTVHVNFSLR